MGIGLPHGRHGRGTRYIFIEAALAAFMAITPGPAFGQLVMVDLGEFNRPTSIARAEGLNEIRLSGFYNETGLPHATRVLGVWRVEAGAVDSITVGPPLAPWNEVWSVGQLSQNGALVAGTSATANLGSEATVWDAVTGVPIGLGPVLTEADSEAFCVADDGSVGGGIWGVIAAVHRPGTGWSTLLPPADEPAPGPAGSVEEITNDTIVGAYIDSSGELRAAKWSNGSPIAQHLDDMGMGDSSALRINGNRIAGYYNGEWACVWIDGVLTPIPDEVSGDMRGYATVALDNGYVFGFNFVTFGAFVWHESWPTARSLDDWYYEISDRNWFPYDPMWVTDGVLIGSMMHLAVWSKLDFAGADAGIYLAYAPCPADLAQPYGLLDLADVLAFSAAHLDQDMAADMDWNGINDLQDVNMFIAAFFSECGG